MFGSSTDLLIRRFMLRVTKPVFLVSFLVIGLLLSLPWVPVFAPEWLRFTGGFHPFVVAFPVGGLGVLLVVEIGKISYSSRWDPPTTWICFFVAVSSVISTLLYYCGVIARQADGGGEEHCGGWMIAAAVAVLLAFLAKFSAVVSRQKILDKLYFLILLVASALVFWCFTDGVVAEYGNPMKAAPWGG